MRTYVRIGYDSMHTVSFIPFLGIAEEPKFITSRGDYPPYGDGPYLKVTLKPTGYTSGGSITKLDDIQYGSSTVVIAERVTMDHVNYYEFYNNGATWRVKCNSYAYMCTGTLQSSYLTTRYKTGPLTEWPASWSFEDIIPRVRNYDWDWTNWAGFNIPLTNWGNLTPQGRNLVFNADPVYPDPPDCIGVFNSITMADVWPGSYATRFAGAYVNAASQMEGAAVNQLGTVLELSQTLVKAYEALRSPMEAFRSLLATIVDPRELWLTYRYSYTTTKLDIESILDLNDQIKTLAQLCEDTFALHGSVYDGGARYSATIKLPLLSVLKDLRSIESYGFDLSGADLWDIVPYSFIVDWFTGIGPMIEGFESWGGSINLEPAEVWYSYFWTSSSITSYFRVPGKRLDILPTYTDAVTSERTVRMRIADTISLFS